MAETKTDASTTDPASTGAAAPVVDRVDARAFNLPLLLSALALVVGAVALILALRAGNSGLGTEAAAKLTARLAAVDDIDGRVQALEADSSPRLDAQALKAEVSTLRAGLTALEGDLAATIEAVNLELSKLKTDRPVIGGAASGSSDASLLTTGALAQVNERLSGLTSSLEGTLTEIGALSNRISTAEAVLQGLPSRIDAEAARTTDAITDLRSGSAARFEDLQGALDEGRNALTKLSAQTDDALTEVRTDLAKRLDDSRASFEDESARLSASVDDLRSKVDEQLASLKGSFTALTDEFTALKEVSVETSTKVLAVNQLRDALASSAPVRPHMTSLQALKPTEAALLTALETIDAMADERVPTRQMLAETIRDLSPKLVSETRINEAEGRGGKVLARLGSLVTVERIEDIETIPGIEGNMARAAARVEEGDFPGALTELRDETVSLDLSEATQGRYDRLVSDMQHRAVYETQRRVLGDWVTSTLNAARATAAN